MTDKTELLPCPFCGDTEGMDISSPGDGDDFWYVGCQSIHCMFQPAGMFLSKEEAIEHWNRRTK